MALTEQLPVYRDVYRLITIVFQVTQNYPRDYKYSLGQDMKRDSLKLVRSIYRANRSVSKREWLEDFYTKSNFQFEDFLDDFEILKLEIRLSVDLHLLSLRKQAEMSPLLESIGKQVTAWKNAGTHYLKG